jgi:hypothetical protein
MATSASDCNFLPIVGPISVLDHEAVPRIFLGKNRYHLSRRFLLDGRRGLHTDQQLVLLAEFLKFGITQAVGLKRLSRFLDPDRLIELQLHGCAARKVDAQIGGSSSDLNQSDDAKYHHDAGEQKRIPALTHEINVRLPENFQHAASFTLDAQLLDFVALINDVKNDLGPDKGGKQVDGNSQAERDGESLDRPSPEQKQRHTGD